MNPSQGTEEGALPRAYASGPGPARPARAPLSPAQRRAAERRKRLRRRFIPLVVTSLVGLFLFSSVVGALRTPGNEVFKAKWADWLRSHHAAFIVNPLESFYYSHQAPSKGGRPTGLNVVPRARGAATAATRVRHLPAPAPVRLVTGNPLPGEGRWTPTGNLIHGEPGMYEAQFRADDVFTGQITTAVWMDPTLVRLSLVPGAVEPGGSWPESPFITPEQLPAAMAAFNGGFRSQDNHGGFYLDGRQQGTLRPGASSFVVYADGHVNVATWGSEVTMTPDVRGVMQNLVPIVDQGVPASAATYGDAKLFGSTLGANTIVARSGLGVTQRGALIYVAGPALSARSLAEALQRAGAVRAMTLDINPEWVTFNFFEHGPTGQPDGFKLYPQMQRPATRYLGPTRESRNFVLVSAPGP